MGIERGDAGARLGAAFAGGPNAFNAVRLGLATWVVLWHCAWLSRMHEKWPMGLEQFVKNGAVDGFFVLSGFLVVGSWTRTPRVRTFLTARASCLLPAFWACLAVTAFVIAPLAVGPLAWNERASYVYSNMGLLLHQPGIADGPGPVAWGNWNFSLWSLSWEAGMYLAVLVLVLGVRRGFVVRALAITALLSWAAVLVLSGAGVWAQIPSTVWLSALPRLSLMFALGALAWFLRDRISTGGGWLALSAVVLACSIPLNLYQVVGGPALGYLLLVGGVRLGGWRWLGWKDDISYGVYLYGFPVQVALMVSPLAVSGVLPLFVLTMAVTVVLAWLSWRGLEQPVMRWVRARRRRARGGPAESGGVGAPAYSGA